MNIARKEKEMQGRFVVEDSGNEVGEMSYKVRNDKKIVIESTEIDESKRGKGLGKKLVLAAVEHARNSDLQIITECEFAEAVFEKTPAYRDVWADKK